MKFWLCVESKRIWWMISEFSSNRSIKMWCSFAPLSILSSNSAGMKGSYPLSTISAVQTYISSQLLRTEVCLSAEKAELPLRRSLSLWSLSTWCALISPGSHLVHKAAVSAQLLAALLNEARWSSYTQTWLHIQAAVFPSLQRILHKGLHTYIQRLLKFEVLKHTLSLGNFIFRLWPVLQSKFNILR